MARLKDSRTEPPGGWRYVQRETGCVITGGSLPELAGRIIEHRSYKKLGSLAMADVLADVERQLCNGLEPRFCTAEPNEDYRPVEDRTLGLTEEKARALSNTVLSFLAGEDEVVNVAESKRRAAICRGCQFNKQARGCTCSAFHKLVAALVPKKRVEPGLEMCAACGCTLRAKILLPMSAIRAGNEGRNINFPDYCWQK